MPPISTAGTAPSQAAISPARKSPSDTGRAGEHRVHRDDAAEHLVRRARLHHRMADDDADRVGGAIADERDQRQHQRGRQAEHRDRQRRRPPRWRTGSCRRWPRSTSARARPTRSARRPRAPSATGRVPTVRSPERRVAKIGSSAVTPPTSTTNRSSDITPSSTLRFQMKEKPANTLSSVIGACPAWR